MISTSDLKSVVTVVVSDIDFIPIMSTEILAMAIRQIVVVFRHILVRMRRKDNVRVFGYNSDNAI